MHKSKGPKFKQAIIIRAYYVVEDQAIQYRERTATLILCFQRESLGY